mmetsp:Transcript_48985/g.93632  ORF Transcript_48985/g.93632 Transcript_48985/m.93632 type:complete len:231 (+) Transcript_48985:172-864(+)
MDLNHVEPDGTAMSMQRSLSQAQWNDRLEEWGGWSVALTHSPWPDEREFYFYRTPKITASPEEVLKQESLPPLTFPDTARMSFQVLLPLPSKDGQPTHTTRGTLTISPEELCLLRVCGQGQVPPSYEDRLPMASLLGWQCEGEDAGDIRVYFRTNQGVCDVAIKTAVSNRVAQCLQALSRQFHEAHQTSPEDCPTSLTEPPSAYVKRYALKSSHTESHLDYTGASQMIFI